MTQDDGCALPRGSTSDEKAALEFVERGIRRLQGNPQSYPADDMKHLLDLKAMLARPVMPEEYEDNAAFERALQAMRDADPRINAWKVYRALRAHLTRAENVQAVTRDTKCTPSKTIYRTSWTTEEGGDTSDDLETTDDALRMGGEYLRRNPGCVVSITNHQAPA